MLYGRTRLLIDYENANRTLSKAKPHKVAAVSISAMIAFNICCQVHIAVAGILCPNKYVNCVKIKFF